MRRIVMRLVASITIAALLGGAWATGVRAEIFACEGDDGVTSYQDQPCPVPKPATTDDDGDVRAEAEAEQPTDSVRVPVEAERTDPELVAACKKRYRDAIDRLDAEIRRGFAAEEGDAYRERARALSQQLSRCDYGGTDKTSGDGGPEPAGRDL